jgi:predicted PurR-regulated permease PerM
MDKGLIFSLVDSRFTHAAPYLLPVLVALVTAAIIYIAHRRLQVLRIKRTIKSRIARARRRTSSATRVGLG